MVGQQKSAGCGPKSQSVSKLSLIQHIIGLWPLSLSIGTISFRPAPDNLDPMAETKTWLAEWTASSEST
jgi:hypothetical protein